MNRGKYYKTKQDYVTGIKSDYISAPQVDGRMEGWTVLIKKDDVWPCIHVYGKAESSHLLRLPWS